jgi:hypothetical protein
VKKYRLSTTISSKHWALLKKYAEEYETQQKALERALESLDSSSLMSSQLTEDDKAWLRAGRDLKSSLVVIPKDLWKVLIETADIERFREFVTFYKPLVMAIEYYYQKPLKKCSMKEVIDCFLIDSRFKNLDENISCYDKGDYYELSIFHSFGITLSEMHVITYGNALESFGAKYESNYSERIVFIKIFKNGATSGAPVLNGSNSRSHS